MGRPLCSAAMPSQLLVSSIKIGGRGCGDLRHGTLEKRRARDVSDIRQRTTDAVELRGPRRGRPIVHTLRPRRMNFDLALPQYSRRWIKL